MLHLFRARLGLASLAATLLLTMAGCGGKTITATSFPVGGVPAANEPVADPNSAGPSPQAGMLAQLPPLPEPETGETSSGRAASDYISQHDVDLRGQLGGHTDNGHVTIVNDRALMTSAPGSLSWLRYSVPASGKDLVHLNVGLKTFGGEGWIAIADYSQQRWRFMAHTTSTAGFDVPAEACAKSSNHFYVLVVAWDGCTVVNDYATEYEHSAIGDAATISGAVRDARGLPLGSVMLALTSSNGGDSCATGNDGNFRVNLKTGGTYTIRLSSNNPEQLSLTPPEQTVTVSDYGLQTGVDFVGQARAVRGRITADGAPLGGVTLHLPQSSGTVLSTVSWPDGSYEFSTSEPGDYAILPVLAGYAFTPPQAQVSVSEQDVTAVDFTAAAGQPTFRVSGHVTDLATHAPLAGAQITFTGWHSHAVFTDINGEYVISGLAADPYIYHSVWASCPMGSGGFVQSEPLSHTVTISDSDVSGVDFDLLREYTITVHVLTPNGVADNRIRVQLLATGKSGTTYQGSIQFAQLPPQSYTVYVDDPQGEVHFAQPSQVVTLADTSMNVTFTGE